MLGKRFVYPFRGVGFDQSEEVSHRGVRGKRGQKVNMVLGSACVEQMTSLAFDDPAHVVVESLAEIGGDLGQPVLRAEDKMVMEAGEGLAHGYFSFLSPLRG